MTRADVIAAGSVSSNTFTGGGTNYLVRTNGGVLYLVFVHRNSDVHFTKSNNNGLTWTNSVLIHAGTCNIITVWYDRWSGINGDLIHVVYVDSATADMTYRSINTAAADALSSPVLIFDGLSTASNCSLSVALGRDGTLRVAGAIDGGTEDGAWSSTDGGVTWADVIADPSESSTGDQYLLLPGWNADPADMMLIFWDSSSNELSVKRYDDSADTWTETLISTTMTDSLPATTFPHVSAFVDLANSRNIIAAWSAVDAANADLRCWIIDDTTITEVTNVVLNSVDDQGFAALGIDTDTGTWYVFYAGKSDGSEVFATVIRLYYKSSSDQGTSWSAETELTADARSISWVVCPPRFATTWGVAYYNSTGSDPNIMFSAPLPAGLGAPIFGGLIVG